MDQLEVILYGPNGTTVKQPIKARRGLRFMEEHNGPGFGTIAIPLSQASAVAYDDVVKLRYNGTTVSAFMVETIGKVWVDVDGSWVTISGRGLLAWLDDAIVYPQWGLRYYSPVDRPFDFAGVGGNFESRVVWTRPLGTQYRNMTDYRKGLPAKWPDRFAYWIWKTSPTASVADGARNWFRSSITLSSTTRLRFYATADNFFRLFVDGTLLLSTSDLRGEGATWKKLASRTITLGAGTHHLAAVVTNGANGSGTNRAGFLCTVTKVTSDGKPGAVVRRSNKTQWWVTDDEPRWYPAEILDVLRSEAIARGASRLSYMTIGWTNTADSSSRAWSTTVVRKIRCGTSLLDVASLCVDLGIDLWLDPASQTLNAYETRGTDRSATVSLRIRKNLESYALRGDATGKTHALVRSADGWTAVSNTAGITSRGRRETFLEFGNTRSETTAAAGANRILSRTAKTTITVERVLAYPTTDAKPFLDFAPGDRIKAVGLDGTQKNARVLSITIAENDTTGAVEYEPELEVSA
jgi:hypothetical protein